MCCYLKVSKECVVISKCLNKNFKNTPTSLHILLYFFHFVVVFPSVFSRTSGLHSIYMHYMQTRLPPPPHTHLFFNTISKQQQQIICSLLKTRFIPAYAVYVFHWCVNYISMWIYGGTSLIQAPCFPVNTSGLMTSWLSVMLFLLLSVWTSNKPADI